MTWAGIANKIKELMMVRGASRGTFTSVDARYVSIRRMHVRDSFGTFTRLVSVALEVLSLTAQ